MLIDSVTFRIQSFRIQSTLSEKLGNSHQWSPQCTQQEIRKGQRRESFEEQRCPRVMDHAKERLYPDTRVEGHNYGDDLPFQAWLATGKVSL